MQIIFGCYFLHLHNLNFERKCNLLVRVCLVIAKMKTSYMYVAVQQGINLQVWLGLRYTLLASRETYIPTIRNYF